MLGFENRTSTPSSDGVGWTRAKLLKRARHRFALHCMHSKAAVGAAERPPRCQREFVQCQKPCCPWKVMRGAAAMLTVAGRALDPQPSPCHPRPSQLHLTAGARLCLWQTPCLSSTPWGRTNPCRSRWHRRPNPQRRRVTAPRRSCHLNLARSSTLLAQRSETSTIP